MRDPLAHFLLAGAVIWGLLALRGEPVDPAERTIVLSREEQAALALGFERTMGRPPTDGELAAQIDRWVREEILYREALRLGLDQGDPAVRRRLAAKMDELAGAEVETSSPSEEVLRQWHSANAERFGGGGEVTFEQLYFDSEKGALDALDEPRPRGMAISLPRGMDGVTIDEASRVFGTQFVGEISQLPVSHEWQGPLPSGFGWHLVRLMKRSGVATQPFESVRDKVEADWRNGTLANRRAEAYRLLRDAYTVEIE
ncbi:peptidyl-prolyl cis-trans isomerase [Qipengyuania gaetbuli]|uniref:peptidylprolyl isomerase n=1 Tax=Qipengyuania gaetbuli TaxID=266952 RepID=UPI001CD691C3|nr:peptidylprolyl isomerase [Qipengyuania gaetbuli]MCA0909781.1 peptidyl-prolyl cis-trans isomerase [Qipengyuania gaetbuli]